MAGDAAANPVAAAEAAVAEGVKKIQIYSSSSSSSSARQVTPFWKEKYERDAKKYWDIFYKRHQDRFFKDRHYLDKEWGHYFLADKDGKNLVVLEVGCGAGNTIFPLVATYPYIIVHACDFSSRAIDLVKGHKDFSADRINAFVCDLTVQTLSEIIEPSSVDIVTMVFVLSAVSPEKMPLVLHNIRRVLKPNGRVLFRDYATGDLAQERLTCKEQQISENFYVRGDGTRAYYFSKKFLANLFMQNGFSVEEVSICSKQVENRSLEIVMNRRWIQAVFCNRSLVQMHENMSITEKFLNNYDDTEVDVSDSIADMFGMSPPADEVIKIEVKDYSFKIKALAKEYQHTCKSTGLMIWESAHLMSNLLAENPSIVAGKKMLELGCGSAGICSMIAAQLAEVVVSTDGDTEALSLLRENIISNLETSLLNKIVVKRLLWGNTEDIKAIKDLCGHSGGFEIIIGTDVTYNYDAISPLFETARELISNRENGNCKPALVLCHIQRRVDESSIISTALHFGFELVDRWVNGMHSSHGGIINSWFVEGAGYMSFFKNTPLAILYFHA
ncbi:uncharacterized protein LOC135587321 isoform X1 [Musa acuminata AAA Group]|uniref:uncharacterized protein LOC135587321 isoform X1 n=1 Tax=Musa acuminata AAA Group TaxID=214697 RepID=UPI0031DB221F